MMTREQLEALAKEIGRARGIPEENMGLFLGLIKHESQWNPRAKNPKSSARGLGQHLDATARMMGYRVTNKDDDPRHDPATAIEMTANHLLEKVKGSGGDWERGVRRYGENTDAYWDKVLGEAQQYGWGMTRPLRTKYVPNAKLEDPFQGAIKGLCSGDTKASNCGDAVALAVNAGAGRQLLPRGGLGTSDVLGAAEAVGAPVLRGGQVTAETLARMGPGTVIRYDRPEGHPDRKYGADHAEVVAVNPKTGQLGIASYTSPDKPVLWKDLDRSYIAKLPENVVVTNLSGSGMAKTEPASIDSIRAEYADVGTKPLQPALGWMSAFGPSEAEAAEIPFKSRVIPEVVKRASGMLKMAPEEALGALEAKGAIPKGWGEYYKPENLSKEALERSWMNPSVAHLDELTASFEDAQRIFSKARYGELVVAPEKDIPREGIFTHWSAGRDDFPEAVAHARFEKVGNRLISIENQSDWQHLIMEGEKQQKIFDKQKAIVQQWQQGKLSVDQIEFEKSPSTTPGYVNYAARIPGHDEPFWHSAVPKTMSDEEAKKQVFNIAMDGLENNVRAFHLDENVKVALNYMQSNPNAKYEVVRFPDHHGDEHVGLKIPGVEDPVDLGYPNFTQRILNAKPEEQRLVIIEELRDMMQSVEHLGGVSPLPPELRGGKWTQASWKSVLMHAAEDPEIKTVSFLDDATIGAARSGGYQETGTYDKRIQREVMKWVRQNGGKAERKPVWEFKEYEQPKLNPEIEMDLLDQAIKDSQGTGSGGRLYSQYLTDAHKNIPKTATWLDVEMTPELRKAIKAGMTLGVTAVTATGLAASEAQAQEPNGPMSIDDVRQQWLEQAPTQTTPAVSSPTATAAPPAEEGTGGFTSGGFVPEAYKQDQTEGFAPNEPGLSLGADKSIDEIRDQFGSMGTKDPHEGEIPFAVDVSMQMASLAAGAIVAGLAAGTGPGAAASPYLGAAIGGWTYQTIREGLAASGLIKTPEQFGEHIVPKEFRPMYRAATEAALWTLMDGMLRGAWRGTETVGTYQQWIHRQFPTAGKHVTNLAGLGGIKGYLKEADALVSEPLARFSQKYYQPYIGDPLWRNVSRVVDLKVPWMGKTIREGLQPAIERLRQNYPVTAGVIDEGRRMKAQARLFGEQLTAYMADKPAVDRAAIIRGLRGYGVPYHLDADLNRITEGLTSNTTGMYQNVFRNALEKGLDFDAPYSIRNLGRYFGVYERRLGTKDPWKVLDAIVRDNDPRINLDMKHYALQLYNVVADTPKRVAEASHLAMMAHIGEGLLNTARVGSEHMLPGYVATKWKPLRGLYVPRDVDLEIEALKHTPSMAGSWYNKWFLPTFKTNKVVLRPAAWFRNIVSNVMLNDIRGLPAHRVDLYQGALKQMRTGGPEWKALQKEFPDLGNFTVNDVKELQTHARWGDSVFDTALRMYNKMAAPARSGYGATESWFKLAKYMHNLEQGMDHKIAAREAMESLFNYAEVTPWVQEARTHILGMPFATWSTKAIPLVAESIVKHPLRTYKWWWMAQQMQSMAMNQTGMSDEEWSMLKENMPSYMQGGLWLLMPWRDGEGNLKMIDLTWTVPGVGDVAEIVRRGGYNPITLLSQSPIVGTLAGLWTKHTETGAPLYYDWELPSVQAAKMLAHVWRAWAPAPAPGGFDWNKLSDALKGVPGALTPGEALGSQLGWKLTSVDPGRLMATEAAKVQLQIGEAQRLWRSELRKATTDSERESINQKYIKTLRRIQKVD